jgi:hypothetical protein
VEIVAVEKQTGGILGPPKPTISAARPDDLLIAELSAALDAEIVQLERCLRKSPAKVVLASIASGKGKRDQLLSALRPFGFDDTADRLHDILDEQARAGMIEQRMGGRGTKGRKWVLTEEAKRMAYR